MDQFVKELTDTLSKWDEDVVLVMYGDHLPTTVSYTHLDVYKRQCLETYDKEYGGRNRRYYKVTEKGMVQMCIRDSLRRDENSGGHLGGA